MHAFEDSVWFQYPMGPRTRRYLGIREQDYRGLMTDTVSDELKNSFVRKFDEVTRSKSEMLAEDVLDLMEELLSMKRSECVFILAREFKAAAWSESTRYLLYMGGAALLEADWQSAETYYTLAQSLSPSELNTYSNLAELFYRIERDGDAIVQAEKGLKIEANNRKLWDIYFSAWIQLEGRESACRKALTLASEINSWMGTVIGKCHTEVAEDPMLRAEVLEDFFNKGIDEDELLVELTGAWGQTQQFVKIINLLQRCYLTKDSEIPWQIYAHAVQAHLAQGQSQQATIVLSKARQKSQIPLEAVNALMQLIDEESKQNETRL